MSSILTTSRRPLAHLLASRFVPANARALFSTAPKSIAGLLQWKPEDAVDHVQVHGYIRSVRAMKRAHFVSLGDGSSLDGVQAVVPADQAEGWDI